MLAEIRFFIGEYASLGPFALDRPVTLGRSSECDLPLPDDGLSRAHCHVEPVHDGVRVTDIGSTNGIYHQGALVSEAHVLFGEEFWIGHTRCLVAVAGVAADSLPPAGQAPMPYGGPTPPPRPAFVGGETGEATMVMAEPPAAARAATSGLGGVTRPVSALGTQPVRPNSSEGPVERTRPPFQSFGGAPSEPPVAKTQAPFVAPAYLAASPDSGGQAPFAGPCPWIRVFVDGEPRPVTGLDLHIVHAEDGSPFVRMVLGYEDPAEPDGGSVSIWLPGA